MASVAAEAGVTGAGSAQVEVVRRRGSDSSYVFVINHGEAPTRVAASGHELITEQDVDGEIEIAGGSVRIIREAAVA
jgi:beta-galactosidase